MPDSPTSDAHGKQHALKSRALSFRYAWSGIRYASAEPNFRIQVGIFAIALVLGAVFHIRSGEWLGLILAGFAVLLMEMLNTVVETVVDLASPDYHPLAKKAKDVAAGAVLLASAAAVIVGIYVFAPRL